MRINGMDGTFYNQALFKDYYMKGDIQMFSSGWLLSTQYFVSRAEAVEFYGHENVQWPADVIAEGSVYVPAEEELQ